MVVLSSESYSYLWINFIKSWKKYCNNFEIKKFLITTNKNKNFTILSSDLDKDDFWSKRIKYALKKIFTGWIIFHSTGFLFSQVYGIKNFKKICCPLMKIQECLKKFEKLF